MSLASVAVEIPFSHRPSPLVAALAQLAQTAPGRAMRHVLEHAPIISFTLDADGTIVRSVGKARDALVARRGETRGRRAQDAYADVPEIVQAVERALRGETVAVRVEVSGLTFDCAFEPSVVDGRVESVEGVAWPPVAPGSGSGAGSGPARTADGERLDAAAASLAASGLTLRQAEIMCWIARGLTAPEIGPRLHLSASTIHTHVGTLRDVLGASQAGGLRRYGQRRDWHLLVSDLDDPEPTG